MTRINAGLHSRGCIDWRLNRERTNGLRRSVAVTIAGQRFALKSDADDAYVHLLASFVDDKIREVQGKGNAVALHQAAVLAALQIADDLLRERRGRAELRRKVKAQARLLLEELAVVEPGP